MANGRHQRKTDSHRSKSLTNLQKIPFNQKYYFRTKTRFLILGAPKNFPEKYRAKVDAMYSVRAKFDKDLKFDYSMIALTLLATEVARNCLHLVTEGGYEVPGYSAG
jgi:hypothetical protein